jgi:hypothetical protein
LGGGDGVEGRLSAISFQLSAVSFFNGELRDEVSHPGVLSLRFFEKQMQVLRLRLAEKSAKHRSE